MKNANRAETSKEARALTVVAKVEKKLRAKGKPNAATVEASSGALSGETIGLDVGDRVSQFCRLDVAGEIAEEGRLHTNAASIEKHFAKLPAAAELWAELGDGLHFHFSNALIIRRLAEF